MKKIITIQHTQSEHHINGMVGSQRDWPLTELGLNQAKIIAQNLVHELKGMSIKLYASDQLRVSQGAKILADMLGIKVHYDNRLREQHLGEAVGQSVEWLKRNILDQNISAHSRLVKGAESLYDVWQRVKPLYDELLKQKEDIIIVYSHGALLSVFNLLHLKLSFESLNTSLLHGRSGSVSLLRILDDGRHSIDRFNDLSYLKSR